LDHCVVTYAAFAENYSWKPKRISVTVLKRSTEDDVVKFAEGYGMAHWFGQSLPSGVYFILPFPLNFRFGKRKWDTVEMAELLFLHERISIGKVRRRKDKNIVTVATRLDPLSSPVQYLALNMPKFDYYSLPDSVRTAQDAFAHIGAIHVSSLVRGVRTSIVAHAKAGGAMFRKCAADGKSKLDSAAVRMKNAIFKWEATISREQSLRSGAALMVLGALIFLVYAVVFFFLAFASSGFEIGVATLNGVTRQQLDTLNPAIVAYITHLHVATAGFIAATAIAVAGLAWYGVRNGLWWAWITGVISPVLGLAVALPLHWMGHFNYDWVSHLGPIYLGTIIYVVGVVVALIGLTKGAPMAAQVGR
jgi:hypothetical protein